MPRRPNLTSPTPRPRPHLARGHAGGHARGHVRAASSPGAHRHLFSLIICALVSASWIGPAVAATAPATEVTDFAYLPLDEILNVKVTITSLVERPADEAPGIVTVITRREIEESGARTLDDLLLFVPGIIPAQDELNARGYGVRGLYAMEGKILVLADGVRINEPLYGNPVFAQQYTTDTIERIEIIRGPASAVYGEYGELAVLNIITRGADAPGGSVSLTNGQGADTDHRRIAGAAWRGRVGPADVSLNGSAGLGHLGDGEYLNEYGQTHPTEEFSDQSFWLWNAGIGYSGLRVRMAGSSLRQDVPFATGYSDAGELLEIPERPVELSYGFHHLDARYAWTPAANLTLTPRITYHRSNTWRRRGQWVFDQVEDPYYARNWYRDFPVTRVNTGLSATWMLNPRMTLVLGGEWNRETIINHLPDNDAEDLQQYFYFYGKDHTRAIGQVRSFFGEYDLRTPLVDVTIGGRLDKNERFETAKLPRLALTRRLGRLYVKALASRAYRPPTLMTNRWVDYEIEPEYATDYEAEVGGQATDRVLLRLNAFAIEMKPVILYSGAFSNTRVQSRGLEAEADYRTDRWKLAATYSLYRAHYADRENAMAEDPDGRLIPETTLGFPTHKGTVSATFHATPAVSLNCGLVGFSRRYERNSSHFWDDAEEWEDYRAQNRELGPALFANLYARASLPHGFDLGAGVFNLLDERYSSLTGTWLASPPVPGPSREFVVRTGFSF